VRLWRRGACDRNPGTEVTEITKFKRRNEGNEGKTKGLVAPRFARSDRRRFENRNTSWLGTVLILGCPRSCRRP
jgi:hypothetical protein